MKKSSHLPAVIIALLLFFVPFFWLKPGFVDLGGDSGRLYFLDPLASAYQLYRNQSPVGASLYAFIPYELFLYVIKLVVQSPTYLISFERGLQLSLAFLSVYAIAIQLAAGRWAGILSGLVYLGFITKVGWFKSLEIHNQVFLNPLLFFLLLRYSVTNNFLYAFGILFVTILFSGNFGYSAAPQILSFFPFAFVSLVFIVTKVFRRAIPWRGLFVTLGLFLGLHAFHILPAIATILDSGSSVHSSIFSNSAIQSSGVHYFAANRIDFGKISMQLFQPALWNSQNILSLLVPVVVVAGFLYKPTRLLAILGGFYALTLFLTSANITQAGVRLYERLFYIPGFAMFRSFWEKWHFVYAFFAALLFGVSFSPVMRNKKSWVLLLGAVLIAGSVLYRIGPFLKGEAVRAPLYQSNNVPGVFTVDPDLLDAIAYVKAIPSDGRFLTLPLTFPYTQVAYGREGGAYVGISLVSTLGGKQDFPGFWRFGQFGYEQGAFDALRTNDIDAFVQILSRLNIRYVFRNSDPRIMDDFPGYPYVYPGMTYSSKDQLPIIKDQDAYDTFLSRLPITKMYEKGFYSVYEINYSPELTPVTPPEETRLRPYFYAGRIISLMFLTGTIALSMGLVMKKKYEIK